MKTLKALAPLLVLLALAATPCLAQTAPRPEGAARAGEPSPAPEAQHPAIRTQLFQVAMVLARTGDGGSVSMDAGVRKLPPAVRKALDDMGDFLPYRSYRMIDSALIRTSRRGIATMKGPGGHDFRVELRFRPGNRDAGEPDLMITGFEVVDMTPLTGEAVESRAPKGAGVHGVGSSSAPKVIISTSFGMSVGETLVVGSSRLDGGDTALISLVTAVR